MLSVQKTLVEAWGIVTETFVDPGVFNQVAWGRALEAGLQAAAGGHSAEEASKQIPALLAKLGDPYTRWAGPKEYSAFRVSSDGEVQGVGMLIASDPNSGRLIVLAPIRGSPAERAGIRPGDEVGGGRVLELTAAVWAWSHAAAPDGSSVWRLGCGWLLHGGTSTLVWLTWWGFAVVSLASSSCVPVPLPPHSALTPPTPHAPATPCILQLLNVGGISTKGWTGDEAAAHLRGERGSSVWVKVARHRDQVPGQVAGSRALLGGDTVYRQFKLQREKVEFTPVFATGGTGWRGMHGYGGGLARMACAQLLVQVPWHMPGPRMVPCCPAPVAPPVAPAAGWTPGCIHAHC